MFGELSGYRHSPKISLSHSRNRFVASHCALVLQQCRLVHWVRLMQSDFTRHHVPRSREIAAKKITPSNSGGAPGPKCPVMAAAIVARGVIASIREARFWLAQAETGPMLGSDSISRLNPAKRFGLGLVNNHGSTKTGRNSRICPSSAATIS